VLEIFTIFITVACKINSHIRYLFPEIAFMKVEHEQRERMNYGCNQCKKGEGGKGRETTVAEERRASGDGVGVDNDVAVGT